MNIRSLFTCTAAALVLCAPVAFAQQWSLGYWEPTDVPLSSLDWGGLTHIAQVAGGPNSDGSLVLVCNEGPCASSQFSGEAATFISTSHSHNVKVLFDIASAWGSGFQPAVENNLSGFVNNIMNVVNTYGYDGVDLDWESSGFNYTDAAALVSALRSRLGSKLLTAAAVVGDEAFWGSVAQNLDRINVMTYDLTGSWNPYSWFNSPLYSDSCDCVWSLDLAKRRFMAAGAPASKLNLGIAFYGYTESGDSGPRQSDSGSSINQVAYNSLMSSYNLSGASWDSTGQVPWISTGSGWITFDNPQSIAAKVGYVKTNNLGGWFMWSLAKDYMAGQNPSHPLLTAIKSAMGPVSTAPSATAPAITTTSLPAGITGTAYAQTVSASGTTPMTWSIASGALPSGLSLNTSSGAISGTPTLAGVFAFTVSAANAAGSDTQSFTLSIAANITSGSGSTSSGSTSSGSTSSPQPSSTASAQFVRLDTATQGNWLHSYGADGYGIANYKTSLPSYAALSLSGEGSYTWESSTTDARALEEVPSGRIASTWFSWSNFQLDLNLSDGASHQVAIYSVDWDSNTRAQTVTVLDAASGKVLDTRNISAFSGGQYLVWNLTGHVIIRATNTGAGNAVISGIFLGGAANAASFAGTDTKTQGSWKGVYGASGAIIANAPSVLPTIATVALSNQSAWTWESSTKDPRALSNVSGNGRAATTWFSGDNFSIDVNITDGHSHQIALYCLDWDSNARAETITVVDAVTGQTLDSRSISNFGNGEYLLWNVHGHVKFQVALTAGGNAVVSGVFLK